MGSRSLSFCVSSCVLLCSDIVRWKFNCQTGWRITLQSSIHTVTVLPVERRVEVSVCVCVWVCVYVRGVDPTYVHVWSGELSGTTIYQYCFWDWVDVSVAWFSLFLLSLYLLPNSYISLLLSTHTHTHTHTHTLLPHTMHSCVPTPLHSHC